MAAERTSGAAHAASGGLRPAQLVPRRRVAFGTAEEPLRGGVAGTCFQQSRGCCSPYRAGQLGRVAPSGKRGTRRTCLLGREPDLLRNGSYRESIVRVAGQKS